MKRLCFRAARNIRFASTNAGAAETTDYLGLQIPTKASPLKDTFARHRQFMPVGDKAPYVAYDAFVANNATVTGRVGLLEASSIWYGAVVRGDSKNLIRVGFLSNIQENAVVHCVPELTSGFPPDVMIGKLCTINQGAILTSCFIGDICTIGQGAVVSEGCVVEYGSMIADGAVLPPYTHVPSKQLWAGNPAKFVREIEEDELTMWTRSAEAVHKLAMEHKEEMFDEEFGTAYTQYEKAVASSAPAIPAATTAAPKTA